MEEEEAGAAPDPFEMAHTALKTLAFADVAALRPRLIPEITIWSGSAGGFLLAGRADSIAVEDGNIIAVLDWKSDVAPSREERSGYFGQLSEYLAATGARRGVLVYMSLGEVL